MFHMKLATRYRFKCSDAKIEATPKDETSSGRNPGTVPAETPADKKDRYDELVKESFASKEAKAAAKPARSSSRRDTKKAEPAATEEAAPAEAAPAEAPAAEAPAAEAAPAESAPAESAEA